MAEQNATDQGLSIVSYLISGLLFYGGLGWLGDQWLKSSFLLPTGIIVGAVAGMYLVIMRYGRSQ